MASTLPDELIIKIAEFLIEPDQYVVVGKSKDKSRCVQRRFTYHNYSETLVSPVTLALISPILPSEYVKRLFSEAIFWFSGPSELYEYLSRSDISHSELAMRRTIRFLRINVICRDNGEDNLSLNRAMRLLPKVVTVDIDYWGLTKSIYTWKLAGPHIWKDPALHGTMVALWPLIERTGRIDAVLSTGGGIFGSSFDRDDGGVRRWWMEEFSVVAGRLRRCWMETDTDPLEDAWKRFENLSISIGDY